MVIPVLSLLTWLLKPFQIMPAGHRYVLTTMGHPAEAIYLEGLHLVKPVAQKINPVSVTIQRGEGDAHAASRDLQCVHTTVALDRCVMSVAGAAVPFINVK